MYSAAMSPPRCHVPRPSNRSCERKRTCARICSGSIPFISANAAGGSCIDFTLLAGAANPGLESPPLTSPILTANKNVFCIPLSPGPVDSFHPRPRINSSILNQNGNRRSSLAPESTEPAECSGPQPSSRQSLHNPCGSITDEISTFPLVPIQNTVGTLVSP